MLLVFELLPFEKFCIVMISVQFLAKKKIILLYLGSLRRLLPRSQFFNEIADNDVSAKTPFADLNSAPSLHYRYFLCVPLTCYCRFATHQEALHDHTFTFKFKQSIHFRYYVLGQAQHMNKTFLVPSHEFIIFRETEGKVRISLCTLMIVGSLLL